MMTPSEVRDPYGQALSMLRVYACEGRFGWGEPLVVKDLAEEFRLSPTPVREAMACLAGEGLIERRRGRGYFFPALTAPDIVDLYGLQWGYVHAALTLYPLGQSDRLKIKAQAGGLDAGALCRTLVGLSNNDAMIAAYDRLVDRLRPVQRAETALEMQCDPDAKSLATSVAELPLERTLELFLAYQSNRCASAGEVARFLQRSAGLKV